MNLPKVLILNQPFNRQTGGGITLSNLFCGWDSSKLAVACTGHQMDDYVLRDVCQLYYQLGELEQKFKFPFKFFNRKYKSGLYNVKSNPFIEVKSNKNPLRSFFINNVVSPIFKYFGLNHNVSSKIISNEFASWLKEFNPEIIYAQVQNREDIQFCLAVKKFLKKPLIFHMMDDWPSVLENRWFLRWWWYKKIDLEFRVLLDEASVLLSISEAMANEYLHKYGKFFLTFNNPIDLSFWGMFQKNNSELNINPKILYAGRIGEGVDESLITIARAVTFANVYSDNPIRFVVQTKSRPKWTKRYSCVIYQPTVDYEKLPYLFADADILILPYDFSASATAFVKYSMPTKVPEYMISGTPIVVFAPPKVAIVEDARRNKWAIIVDENNYQKLGTTFKSLLENEKQRKELSTTAKKIAEEKYDKNKVTVDFKRIFIDLNEAAFKEKEEII